MVLLKINEHRELLLNQILESQNGDYVLQAQTLAKMKPDGW